MLKLLVFSFWRGEIYQPLGLYPETLLDDNNVNILSLPDSSGVHSIY